jgi:UDP-2,4-diacetamido-2,4,6-trideoxy-beta-L-altropyranose hydrolase
VNVVFRVDSSEIIGSGHVMRCLTLAEALRGSGVAIEFITRDHPGNLNEYFMSRGFKTHLLPYQEMPESQQILSGYEQWLGVPQAVDAAQTIEEVEGKVPDWLIIDHYALDREWEERLRPHTEKVMVIDDLANRNHDCDLLLDQNLFEDVSVRYQGKVPEECTQLLGPQYALLQPDYAELRTQAKLRKSPLNHLLVFFGSADRHNLTGLTISALEQINIPFERIDLVISRQSSHYKQVKTLTEHLPMVELHSDLPSLAPFMVKADLAIGGGGVTSWERFCLGLPSLVITLADNQRPVCSDLHNMNLIEWVGDVETIQIDQVSSAIQRILSLDDINNWSERCMAVCQGRGSAFVADTMLKLSTGL